MSKPGPERLPLALGIAAALILKVLILSLLWKACFSTPQTKKMRMPTSQVEQHLLAPPAPPATLSQQEHHDSP